MRPACGSSTWWFSGNPWKRLRNRAKNRPIERPSDERPSALSALGRHGRFVGMRRYFAVPHIAAAMCARTPAGSAAVMSKPTCGRWSISFPAGRTERLQRRRQVRSPFSTGTDPVGIPLPAGGGGPEKRTSVRIHRRGGIVKRGIENFSRKKFPERIAFSLQ